MTSPSSPVSAVERLRPTSIADGLLLLNSNRPPDKGRRTCSKSCVSSDLRRTGTNVGDWADLGDVAGSAPAAAAEAPAATVACTLVAVGGAAGAGSAPVLSMPIARCDGRLSVVMLWRRLRAIMRRRDCNSSRTCVCARVSAASKELKRLPSSPSPELAATAAAVRTDKMGLGAAGSAVSPFTTSMSMVMPARGCRPEGAGAAAAASRHTSLPLSVAASRLPAADPPPSSSAIDNSRNTEPSSAHGHNSVSVSGKREHVTAAQWQQTERKTQSKRTKRRRRKGCKTNRKRQDKKWGNGSGNRPALPAFRPTTPH